ncbi:calcium-binding protein [Phenylobacterium sp.]|uniref:calcium-binding protein n=1 Tax=Phenylobacterium sp. TaxID=1871053 RepID=UPI0025E89AD4|nr:calcium-binding protein [Phenylobacterium sp.]
MLEYAFDTITPEQALAIRAGDTLTFNGGPARTVSVTYQSYDPLALTPEVPRIFVTYGGRTVAFSTDLAQLSKTGGLVMADGSKLYIGDASDDRTSGSAGDDALYGGPGADTLDGGAGRDLLQGNGGADVLTGGEGADTIYGGQGDDAIHTSADVNGVAGEAGDWAHGNAGDDDIVGGAGADTLLGGQGNDLLAGRDGNDYLSGDLGDDELFAGEGWNTLVGGAGNDTLNGGFGPNFLVGGGGNDLLVSQGPVAATMDGGEGADTIVAGSSAKDLIFGGAGWDRFEIVAKADPSVIVDAEIRDWEAGDQLHFAAVSILTDSSILPRSYSEFVTTDYATALSIANEHISAAGATYVAAQVGSDVYVFADTGDPADGADVAILLTGRTLADIGLGNFV